MRHVHKIFTVHFFYNSLVFAYALGSFFRGTSRANVFQLVTR